MSTCGTWWQRGGRRAVQGDGEARVIQLGVKHHPGYGSVSYTLTLFLRPHTEAQPTHMHRFRQTDLAPQNSI